LFYCSTSHRERRMLPIEQNGSSPLAASALNRNLMSLGIAANALRAVAQRHRWLAWGALDCAGQVQPDCRDSVDP